MFKLIICNFMPHRSGFEVHTYLCIYIKIIHVCLFLFGKFSEILYLSHCLNPLHKYTGQNKI